MGCCGIEDGVWCGCVVGTDTAIARRFAGRDRGSRLRRPDRVPALRTVSPAGLGMAEERRGRGTDHALAAAGHFARRFLGTALESRVPARFLRLLFSPGDEPIRTSRWNDDCLPGIRIDPRSGNLV